MNEHQKTIRSLLERDRELRTTIDRLAYRYKKRKEFETNALSHLRGRLTSLVWTIQLLRDNAKHEDPGARVRLEVATRAARDARALIEDLIRTLEDPA
ncbi:MAG: hypothetical protein HYW81_01215 [Parcubacteria group bacterium]|nr:hypothetical protein [Parcubacteria group bacterium]